MSDSNSLWKNTPRDKIWPLGRPFLLIFRLRRFFPPSAIFPAFGGHAPFFVFFPVRSSESDLGSGSKSSAMKFCIEWSNRELLGPSRRRDMASSLFLSAFGGRAPSVLWFFMQNRANQTSGVVPRVAPCNSASNGPIESFWGLLGVEIWPFLCFGIRAFFSLRFR